MKVPDASQHTVSQAHARLRAALLRTYPLVQEDEVASVELPYVDYRALRQRWFQRFLPPTPVKEGVLYADAVKLFHDHPSLLEDIPLHEAIAGLLPETLPLAAVRFLSFQQEWQDQVIAFDNVQHLEALNAEIESWVWYPPGLIRHLRRQLLRRARFDDPSLEKREAATAAANFFYSLAGRMAIVLQPLAEIDAKKRTTGPGGVIQLQSRMDPQLPTERPTEPCAVIDRSDPAFWRSRTRLPPGAPQSRSRR